MVINYQYSHNGSSRNLTLPRSASAGTGPFAPKWGPFGPFVCSRYRLGMETAVPPDRLTELLDTAAQVSEKGELRGLLESIVDIAMGLTGAKYGALGVLGSHGFLVEFVYRGIDSETASRIGHLPMGIGVLGSISRGKVIRSDHVQAHPESAGFPTNHPRMDSFLGVPLRTKDEVFGHIYLTEKSGGFTDSDQQTIETLALIASSAVSNFRIHRRLREAAVAEDRARIARDVHDDIIQDLFAVGLALQSLADTVKDPEIREVVGTQVSRVDGCITSLRQFIFDLRRPAELQRDLKQEISELVEELSEPYDATLNVAVDPLLNCLSNDYADAVLHIIKEATSNALRHSGSPRVDVRVTGSDDRLAVSVIDEGGGFDPEGDYAGLGLANLRQRAAEVGGTLEIDSGPTGTTVTLIIPITDPQCGESAG